MPAWGKLNDTNHSALSQPDVSFGGLGSRALDFSYRAGSRHQPASDGYFVSNNPL